MIAALWKVEDVSSLTLSRFYESHINKSMSPKCALHAAKMWFRDITVSELCNFIIAKRESGAISERTPRVLLDDENLKNAPKHARPFQHLYYWAAYMLFGC